MPWARIRRSRLATPSSSVVIIPPSPVTRFLFEKNEKHETSPIDPARPAAQEAPGAWAASSTSAMPWRSASARSAAISPIQPP